MTLLIRRTQCASCSSESAITRQCKSSSESSAKLSGRPLPSFPLHLLQAVSAGSDEQAEKVDLRELLNWNVNLLLWTARAFLLVILNRWAEVRVGLESFVDEANSLILKLLAVSNFASVSTPTMCVVSRGRRRGTKGIQW
jgi:hypothetical protein